MQASRQASRVLAELRGSGFPTAPVTAPASVSVNSQYTVAKPSPHAATAGPVSGRRGEVRRRNESDRRKRRLQGEQREVEKEREI